MWGWWQQLWARVWGGGASSPPPPPPPGRRPRIPASLREQVWNAYVGEGVGSAPCPVCRHRVMTPFHFHCGHVVAHARGGPTTVGNLRPICGACNRSMGTQNLDAFRRAFHPSH